MIAMSFMSAHTNFEGVSAEYMPAHGTDYGLRVQAYVALKFGKNNEGSTCLKIEDARTVVEALTRILMLHDSVEHLAAEMSVDNEVPVAALESAQKAVA